MARWLALLSTLGLATAARASVPAAESPPAPAAESPPEARPWSLDLSIPDFGVGMGISKHVDGLRLNFRDSAPYTVHGIRDRKSVV